MVDTWATVGSCAQIGANVHLSGGVGHRRRAGAAAGGAGDRRGRLLHRQPLHRGRGGPRRVATACSAPAASSPASVPVIDAQTGAEVGRGHVPPNSVAITATRARQFGSHAYGLPCVLVMKHLNEGERHEKSVLNDILRDHGATICPLCRGIARAREPGLQPAQHGDDPAEDADVGRVEHHRAQAGCWPAASMTLPPLRVNVLTVASSPGMPATTISPLLGACPAGGRPRSRRRGCRRRSSSRPGRAA